MKIYLLQLVAMFGLIIRLYAADSNNVLVLDTKYHDLPLDCSFSITSRIVNVCSKYLDNIDVTSACGCLRIVSCPARLGVGETGKVVMVGLSSDIYRESKLAISGQGWVQPSKIQLSFMRAPGLYIPTDRTYKLPFRAMGGNTSWSDNGGYVEVFWRGESGRNQVGGGRRTFF